MIDKRKAVTKPKIINGALYFTKDTFSFCVNFIDTQLPFRTSFVACQKFSKSASVSFIGRGRDEFLR
jgi:hypothetical protein